MRWLCDMMKELKLRNVNTLQGILWLVGDQYMSWGRNLQTCTSSIFYQLLCLIFITSCFKNLLFINNFSSHMNYLDNSSAEILKASLITLCDLYICYIWEPSVNNICWKCWSLFLFLDYFIIHINRFIFSLCNFFKLIEATNIIFPKSWYVFQFLEFQFLDF